MSADLHIHVVEGLEEGDLAEFFSDECGSKYFDPEKDQNLDEKYHGAVYSRVIKTPSVWIGEVSWLKAALLGDKKKYIPDTVQIIQDLIGEDLPQIDERLITDILAAFDQENQTQYKLADKKKVEAFLKDRLGKKLFCLSW